MARLYSSFFQINLQCPQLFKLFLQIISHWPSFENCLDYVFSESGADLSVLQYHCPTAAKFRYLLSEGKEEDLLVAPDNTVLYTTSKPFNITLSSSLMQLNYGGEGLPLCAAVNQPENAYNYVLFKKPTTPRLHYLDKAVWNGFLQQIILTQNEFKIMKIARGMQIETRQIDYFPSLPIITHLPVVTPPWCKASGANSPPWCNRSTWETERLFPQCCCHDLIPKNGNATLNQPPTHSQYTCV